MMDVGEKVRYIGEVYTIEHVYNKSVFRIGNAWEFIDMVPAHLLERLYPTEENNDSKRTKS